MPTARVVSLHARPYSTCALSARGEVACWGESARAFGVPTPDDSDDVLRTATRVTW